jgi:predicted nucleic acid-binding protein
VVIVDTTVWIDYLQGISNPETDWLDAQVDRRRLGLTDSILCEVVQGVRDDASAKNVERQLLKLEVLATGGVGLARERHGTIAPYGVAAIRCEKRSIV